MAELDIYIKDLIRRCQFPQEEQESHKIDLLYHATAHFEVRKFVHNANQETDSWIVDHIGYWFSFSYFLKYFNTPVSVYFSVF